MPHRPTRPERRSPQAPGRAPDTARPLRLVFLATFFSSFDRLLIAPLLIPVARDLGVPVAQVAAMATAYLVGYGLMQVVWGVLFDRLGRVRAIRLALCLAAVAGVASAAAPGLPALVGARLLAGAAFAAVVPGAIVYIGDTVPAARRHAPLTDLMTATAVGMAAATLVGGVLADTLGWRAAFAVPAVLVVVVAVLLRRAPEPAERASGPLLRPLASALRRPWVLVVLAIVLVEGMVLLGVLTYLPTTLRLGGMGAAESGLVTAAYGVGVMLCAGLVKRLSRRLASHRLIAVGGSLGVLAFTALVADQGWRGVLAASLLLAGAWAFMHSTLQTWATEVAPRLRATVVSLFASCLFLGSALWTALGARPVGAGELQPYFAWGLAVTAALTAAATWARRRYPA